MAAWLGHIVANVHRGPTTPPYTPAQMHPDTAGQAAQRPTGSGPRLNRRNFASFRRRLVGS